MKAFDFEEAIRDGRRRRLQMDIVDQVLATRRSYHETAGWPDHLDAEQGEVKRAFIRNDKERLHRALIELAAISLAWLEEIHPADDIPGNG